MKKITGDLIELANNGEFDVILHGCNCMRTMNRGIAKLIRQAFPAAYDADCEFSLLPHLRLGKITATKVQIASGDLWVVNCYTQLDWRGPGVLVSYDALRSAMRETKRRFHGLRIGYPKIGCGLARGNWSIASQIISEELCGENHAVVTLPGDSD